MRNELEHISYIESFLLNTMEANERTKFEQRLQNDVAFARDVQQQQLLTSALHRLALLQHMATGKRLYKQVRLIKQLLWAVVIAGLLAAGLYLFSRQKTETFPPVHQEQSVEVAPAPDTAIPQQQPAPAAQQPAPAQPAQGDSFAEEFVEVHTDTLVRQSVISVPAAAGHALKEVKIIRDTVRVTK